MIMAQRSVVFALDKCLAMMFGKSFGGMVSNSTDLGVSVNGGTAISDASGGSYNLAFVS